MNVRIKFIIFILCFLCYILYSKVGYFMKKYFKIILVSLFVVFFCSACNGDVTRALRHDGFSVSDEKFVCDALFEKGSTIMIRFMTPTHLITTDGVIYEISPGKKYSNNQNCKLANTDLRVSAIFDNSVFLATNGGIYRLVASNDAQAYTEVNSSDNSYALYSLLFNSSTGIKIMTADSQNGIYYVLSKDGNVYGYTIYNRDRSNGVPEVAGIVIVYHRLDYGDIYDFNYVGNSPATYVRSNDKIYHLESTNADECSTYADIACEYVMTEDETLEENKDYILAYSGSNIITTYQRFFTLGGN